MAISIILTGHHGIWRNWDFTKAAMETMPRQDLRD